MTWKLEVIRGVPVRVTPVMDDHHAPPGFFSSRREGGGRVVVQ